MKVKLYEHFGDHNEKLIEETSLGADEGEFIIERADDGKFAFWMMPDKDKNRKLHNAIKK